MEALNPRWLSIELNDVNREVESRNSGRVPFNNSAVQDVPRHNHANQKVDASDQSPEPNQTRP